MPRALRSVAILGVLVTLFAAVLEIGSALGVALGALVAALNLWIIGRVVAATFRPSGARLSYGVVALFKFLGLIGGLYLLVDRQVTDPLSLILGYASLPVGILISELKLAPAAPPESPNA